jgi:uncharacterized protein YkwD
MMRCTNKSYTKACLRLALAILLAVPLAACGVRDADRSDVAATPPFVSPTPVVEVRVLVSPPPAPSIRVSARPRLPTATAVSQLAVQPATNASPQPNETAVPAPTPPDEVAAREAQLVAEINRVRAENGLPPYRHSVELSAAARAHSCDLAAHGLISHESSDGRSVQDRLAGAEPPWEWPSESIAAGTDDPLLVVAMWMDEPPDGWHRRNILDADQREVGVGYCFAAEDASGNHHYWTADFSRRGE